jgi:hypothetical protein
MEAVDLFCPRCRRHQRLKRLSDLSVEGESSAYSGRCPTCGAWLFRVIRLRRTA